MDAKNLGVTLGNDLEWSKHTATMTNKANSKLLFLCRNLKQTSLDALFYGVWRHCLGPIPKIQL